MHVRIATAALATACVAAAQNPPPTAPAPNASPAPAPAEAAGNPVPDVPAGQTGIEWNDLVKSGSKLTFYGFLRLDAYYNTARANHVIIPQQVLAEDGVSAKPNDDQFSLDPRLTRFGFDVQPGEVAGTEVKGKLEIDFANFVENVAESRATPRMRLAYVDLGWDEWSFRFGQDWDVISPLFPAVNHELLMWNAGNTGDRRPQMTGSWRPKSEGDTQLEMRLGLGLTGAINNQNLDPSAPGVSAERDGFDFGAPQVQMRAGLKTNSFAEKKKLDIGVWGAIGGTETDTALGPDADRHFMTWIGGIDVSLPLSEEFTFRGEGWLGENLGDFRGGIGQTVNTTTGEEIASMGGFAEVWWQTSKQTRFHIGGTIDDPDDDDLNVGNPNKNYAGYIGTVIDYDSGVRMGFDTIYWETKYEDAQLGNMVRFNLYFQYNF